MFDFIWSTTITTTICRGCDIGVAFRLNQCIEVVVRYVYCSLCKLENYTLKKTIGHEIEADTYEIWIIITNYESVNATSFDSAYLLSLLGFTQRSSIFELSCQIKLYVSLWLNEDHMILFSWKIFTAVFRSGRSKSTPLSACFVSI